ncbi:MAG TPA: RHS repeat-associated core domain-containing protein, partial [Candidatus Angelobacter sp.]
VQKSDGTLYWIDDFLRPLSVGTTSGSITRDYIFLGGKRIAFVPLSSGNPYYYLSDHLGSTAVVASGDGKTIQWEADYFPFGSPRTVITNLADNPYQFTGYEYDSGTGYNYAVARFDAGRWGRFLSPDPYRGSMDITNPQSLNRFAYVSGNPMNSIDPKGLSGFNAQTVNCMFDESGNCVAKGGGGGGNGSLIMGNDIFDALAGAPGTYFNLDNGSINWGFSTDKWYADQAALEAAAAANDSRQTPEVEAACEQKICGCCECDFWRQYSQPFQRC